MSINQLNNGDSGLTARTIINQTVTSVNSILSPNPVAAITSSFPWSASRASGINSGIVASYYRADLTAGDGAVAHGRYNTASGQYSHAEGAGNQAIGEGSHAEGAGTQAIGNYSHAEGASTQAIEQYSHAEGESTQAIGYISHAEGYNTKASGSYSHAEGNSTQAIGGSSHAEGYGNKAIGILSHAEGYTNNVGLYGWIVTNISDGIVTLDSNYGDISNYINIYISSSNILVLYGPFPNTQNLPTPYHELPVTIIGPSSFNGTSTEIYIDNTYLNATSPFITFAGILGISQPVSASFDYNLFGYGSHAEGIDNNVAGDYSHAEGKTTSIIGSWAHTEGRSTIAKSDGSHAEGYNTTASGQYDHTEGIGSSTEITKAYEASIIDNVVYINGSIYGNVISHFTGSGESDLWLYAYDKAFDNTLPYALGRYILPISSSVWNGTDNLIYLDQAWIQQNIQFDVNTSLCYVGCLQDSTYALEGEILNWTGDKTIPGNHSHAEGDTSRAFGEQSHAEGYYSTSTWTWAHAEGHQNRANGICSHAEGSQTQTGPLAHGAHSEGYKTIAYGNESHAEGSGSISYGLRSHAEGFQTQTGGLKGFLTDLVDYTNKTFILSGSYGDITSIFPLDGLVLLDGYLSLNADFAVVQTSGSAFNGTNTIVTFEIISGNPSIFQAYNSLLAVSLNYPTAGNYRLSEPLMDSVRGEAFGGLWAHSEGYQSKAIGILSHAEGYQTLALGPYSHTEGYQTTSSGNQSHAEGYLTKAYGNLSHAEGHGTKATKVGSHAEGYYTQAIGNYSHAEGNTTTASGSHSHAEGIFVQAIGNSSHAEGNATITLGDSSHAEGNQTIAFGDSSHAEGANNIALGYGSHTEGIFTTASGIYSHAEGYGTITSASYQHATGRLNLDNNTEDYFVIGDGDINTGIRSNAFGVNDVRMYASNSIFFPDLTQSPEPNVLVFNTASGQVFFTASSAIGGGGSTSPGGTNHDVQFNDNGTFGGEQYFRYFPESRSVSIGNSSGGSTIIPQGTNNLSVGYTNVIIADNAAAFGNQSKVYANNSIAFGGFENTTYSGNSLVGGYQSYISGSSNGSFAFGYKNVISGSENSFALGANNQNLGPGNSLVGGGSSTITGSNSGFVWGNSCLVSGDGGNNSVATAMGLNATASGGYGAFAAGYNIVAAGPSQTVVGKNNIQNNTTDLFVVGNGTNTNTRSDAFKVHATGYVVMPYVSASCNFADDTAAQAGGVPLGGIYHTNGALKIRLV